MVQADASSRTIPLVTLGLSLSAFLAVSYVLCIVGYLILPGLPVKHEALSIFLPGFELLSCGPSSWGSPKATPGVGT